MSKTKAYYLDVDKVETPWEFYERILNDPEYDLQLIDKGGRTSDRDRKAARVTDDLEDD